MRLYKSASGVSMLADRLSFLILLSILVFSFFTFSSVKAQSSPVSIILEAQPLQVGVDETIIVNMQIRNNVEHDLSIFPQINVGGEGGVIVLTNTLPFDEYVHPAMTLRTFQRTYRATSPGQAVFVGELVYTNLATEQIGEESSSITVIIGVGEEGEEESSYNMPPTCRVSANPTSGEIPLHVMFQGIAADPDGFIQRYDWDFNNDGRIDHSSTTSGIVSARYESLGTFTAVFYAYDNYGGVCSKYVLITVYQKNQPPKAILEIRDEEGFQPSTAEAPLQIWINSSGEDDKKVLKYHLIVKHWDGKTTKEMVNIERDTPIIVNKTLEEPGIYEITLKVWDAEGETDTTTQEIMIEEKVEAAIPIESEELNATIINFNGDEVEVQLAGTNRWIKPEIGMKISPGSWIATGMDSNVTLGFVTNAVVRINEFSEIKVDRFLLENYMEPQRSIVTAHLKMTYGKIQAHVDVGNIPLSKTITQPTEQEHSAEVPSFWIEHLSKQFNQLQAIKNGSYVGDPPYTRSGSINYVYNKFGLTMLFWEEYPPYDISNPLLKDEPDDVQNLLREYHKLREEVQELMEKENENRRNLIIDIREGRAPDSIDNRILKEKAEAELEDWWVLDDEEGLRKREWYYKAVQLLVDHEKIGYDNIESIVDKAVENIQKHHPIYDPEKHGDPSWYNDAPSLFISKFLSLAQQKGGKELKKELSNLFEKYDESSKYLRTIRNNPFGVSRPSWGAGVAGTTFSISYDEESNTYIIEVFDGIVEIYRISEMSEEEWLETNIDDFEILETIPLVGYGNGRGQRATVKDGEVLVEDLTNMNPEIWDLASSLKKNEKEIEAQPILSAPPQLYVVIIGGLIVAVICYAIWKRARVRDTVSK